MVVDGEEIPPGTNITWRYEVTNTGNLPLSNINVTDDKLGVVTDSNLVGGDINNNSILDVNETWIYEVEGTADAGQYNNTGTVTGVSDNGTVTDEDPTSYFGAANPSITIDATINGDDGEEIPPGTNITWRYEVTNTGNLPLSNINVTDDKLGVVTDSNLVGGDINNNSILDVNETWIYEVEGTADAGQYNNTGTVTGVSDNGTVTDEDPTSYFGAANPSITIDATINGGDGEEIPPGTNITWRYEVTNTGNLPLSNINVTDDKLGVVTDSNLVGGDDNNNSILDVNETWIYEVEGTADAGQYNNTGTVTGVSDNGTVTDEDPTSYFGAANPSITIDATINGDDGEEIPPGTSITWRYEVTNTGNLPLSNINVTDDKLGVVTDSNLVGGDINNNSILDVNETWIYEVEGTADAGQYNNTSTVTGVSDNGTVTDEDTTSYFGAANPSITIDATINGDDGEEIPPGTNITWRYEVTNTGNLPLSNINVTDDKLGVVTDSNLVGGDNNNNSILDVNETWIYEVEGTADAGQYNNTGTVTGVSDNGTVTDEDPTSYFGAANPSITIDATTNGDDGEEIPPGTNITWRYEVTNTGNLPLSNINVTDDKLGVVTDSNLVGGDDNNNSILDVNETWIYEVEGTADAGQYNNTGTVTGVSDNGTVTDEDPTSYFGAANPSITIDATINGGDGEEIPARDQHYVAL